jgi:WD40 repeat protein
MGGGASASAWKRQFHITSNVEDLSGESYMQVFPIWALAITSNQRQLATATSDNRINLWCLVTHNLLIPLTGHADTIWCIAYSPDDTLLASASADGTVRLWEVSTGLPVMTLPRNHANWVCSLAWSPDGCQLATGGSDARILIWDAIEAADAAREVAACSMRAEEDPIWLEEAARKAEDAARAAQPLLYWQAHEKSIKSISFAPSESAMLVSVGAEGTVAVWNAHNGNLDCRLMGHIGAITCVAVHPENEECIASGGDDHTVRIWDLRDINPGSMQAKNSREKQLGMNLAHFTLKGHEGGVTQVQFTGDGQLLASASKDCQVRIWIPNLENPTLYAKFAAHEAWVKDIVWTGDQHHLYTASSDGMVFAWSVPRKFHAKLNAVEKKAMRTKK